MLITKDQLLHFIKINISDTAIIDISRDVKQPINLDENPEEPTQEIGSISIYYKQ